MLKLNGKNAYIDQAQTSDRKAIFCVIDTNSFSRFFECWNISRAINRKRQCAINKRGLG